MSVPACVVEAFLTTYGGAGLKALKVVIQYIRWREERLTVKLTAAETALLAVRLQAAINAHAITYMDKNAELSMLLEKQRGKEGRGRRR